MSTVVSIRPMGCAGWHFAGAARQPIKVFA